MITKIVLALMVFTILSPVYVYAVPGIFTVELEGTSVDVSFDAEGIEIISTEADLDFVSLILEVEVSGSPGILEITFTRNFFDATLVDGGDDEFIILGDGFDELDFEETDITLESRTLRIEIPNGTEDVEIIGTTFGEPEPPAEEPPAEEPPAEEPPAEEPPVPTSEPTKPKTQCGPGTVLKNGVCALEEKCGPGTILQDGVCIASPSASTGPVSISKDFLVGGGIALSIAFILMIFFALVAKGSRQNP